MRPIYIKFQAFGPYVEEQYVDFEALEKNGLFLICGETGAGKTTILDAMTYALYGQSSGGERGSVEKMRCNLAPQDKVTWIEYVFEAAGKRYQFQREIRFARKKYNVSQNSMVLGESGQFEPLHENPTATKVNQDAENILGLSYDQFRQVIILPQGQFEKLLTSNSSEKEQILVSIFKAERWQEMSEAVYQKAKIAYDACRSEREDVERRLAEYECDGLDGLQGKIDETEFELAEQTTKIEEWKKKKEALEKKREPMLHLEKLFQKYDETEQKVVELQAQTILMQQKQKQVLDGEKAARVEKQAEQYEGVKEAWKQRVKQENKEKESVLEKERLWKSEQAAYEEYREKASEMEQIKSDVVRYTERIEIYEQMERLMEAEKTAKTSRNQTRETWSSEKEELENQQTCLLEQQKKQQKIMEEHQRIYQAYLAGISGRLAGQLEEGRPCPVCGSTNHPDKAKLDSSTVTDEMLKEVEEKEKKIQHKIDEIREILQTQELAVQVAETAYTECETKYTECLTTLQLAQEKKIEGISTLENLQQNIEDMNLTLTQYESQGVLLNESLQKKNEEWVRAKEAAKQAEQESNLAKQEYEKAKNILETALRNEKIESIEWVEASRMSEEEQKEFQTEITTWKANLHQLQKEQMEQAEELRGKKMPQKQEVLDEIEKVATAQEECLRVHAVLELKRKNMKTLHQELTQRMKQFEAQYVKAEANLQFAKQLRGDSGVGVQRYVLGVMLSAITVEANQLLRHVHGGRYQLYRTDTTSGKMKKTGLELEVRDANANQEGRGVRSLSGGEKFLVALSLSIGLSTIAQKQGMKMEAMFIDEGFGSLDRSSIGDALDVLSNIQRSNGLVGIISHVQVLRDNIPSQIRIEKSRQGSHLTVV